jgi:hypothetical protein
LDYYRPNFKVDWSRYPAHPISLNADVQLSRAPSVDLRRRQALILRLRSSAAPPSLRLWNLRSILH